MRHGWKIFSCLSAQEPSLICKMLCEMEGGGWKIACFFFSFLTSSLWFHISTITSICMAVMWMVLVHVKISQLLLHGKKGKISVFFLRLYEISSFPVGSKSYICLESNKRFHVDFNSTVKYRFGGSCLFLGNTLCVPFFHFFFLLSIAQWFRLA